MIHYCTNPVSRGVEVTNFSFEDKESVLFHVKRYIGMPKSMQVKYGISIKQQILEIIPKLDLTKL